MEYQKVANLTNRESSSEPSKFKTKNWVEVNDESRGTYNINSQIKFKTTMLKPSLCDYNDAYILVKRTITVNNTAAADADVNNTNEKIIFKNYAPFTNCISEINNTHLDNAKDLDIVMPMYNLTEYSDNYSKTSGSLWQYCKDIPAVNNKAIVDFTDNNLTDSFNFKVKMTGQTGNNGTKNVEIMVPIKYLSNFWRTSEMIGNSGDEANFSHKLLLTSRQVANLRKAFANHISTDIKLSKAQLTKMQKGGFLRFLAPFLKSELPLLKSVIKSLGMLGLTTAASATDPAINKKILESGNHTTLIISNDDMHDLLKIVKSLEDSGLLLDGITETVKNEVKEQKGGFLSVLLGTLGASLLGNMLVGRGVIRAGEGTIRAGYGSKKI